MDVARDDILIPIFRKKKGAPAARASQGDVGLDRQAMDKNRERVRFSPHPGRRDRPGEGRTYRTRHTARRDGFQDSLRGEISSCGGSAPRGGVRDACAAMWLGDTARSGTLWGGTAKEAERSPAPDVPCRARSDALRRVPSSPLPEISARNKSSILLVIDVESGTGHGRLRASSFALLRNDHLNVADGVAGNFVCVEDEVPAVLGQVEVVVRSDITLQGVLADFHDDGIL